MSVTLRPLDIAALRQQTPASAGLLHFNNAGAALSPQPVVDAMLRHLSQEQRLGGYEAAAQAQPQIDNFYQAAARLIGCNEQEIAYCSSASEGWHKLLLALPLEAGARVVINQSEYAGNYLTLLQQARLRNLIIDIVPNDAHGNIDLLQLENRLQASRPALLAMTHVPSQCGKIHPVARIGALARNHGVPYLVDAAQSAGQLPVNVAEIGCDMLVTTGRKYLRGPRGTGFVYVRESMLNRLQPPVMDLHSGQWLADGEIGWRPGAQRLETWEHSVAAKIALGRAIDYATTLGIDNIERRVSRLAGLLRDRLASMSGVQVHEQGEWLSGLVTFSVDREPATELQLRLQRHAINTSVLRRCNTMLDFEPRGLDDINRASLHYYNTEAEIERFCQVLAQGLGPK